MLGRQVRRAGRPPVPGSGLTDTPGAVRGRGRDGGGAGTRHARQQVFGAREAGHSVFSSRGGRTCALLSRGVDGVLRRSEVV